MAAKENWVPTIKAAYTPRLYSLEEQAPRRLLHTVSSLGPFFFSTSTHDVARTKQLDRNAAIGGGAAFWSFVRQVRRNVGGRDRER